MTSQDPHIHTQYHTLIPWLAWLAMKGGTGSIPICNSLPCKWITQLVAHLNIAEDALLLIAQFYSMWTEHIISCCSLKLYWLHSTKKQLYVKMYFRYGPVEVLPTFSFSSLWLYRYQCYCFLKLCCLPCLIWNRWTYMYSAIEGYEFRYIHVCYTTVYQVSISQKGTSGHMLHHKLMQLPLI